MPQLQLMHRDPVADCARRRVTSRSAERAAAHYERMGCLAEVIGAGCIASLQRATAARIRDGYVNNFVRSLERAAIAGSAR
ncbi:hypothetical protein [Sphingomonas montanisoli]|uniref:Uncharacterized protein n=1 Tax=Sphingomonas montanisoli TaxID=2606412 RepID=A0A5D9BZM5_9SPHN|nr:hypothetical protein [Sphingomonas montanisoli]TZG24894.1 hypothetical protein FYJ91_16575 [Sphingomonas montanisoli]